MSRGPALRERSRGRRGGCFRPLVTVIRATSSGSSAAGWSWSGRSRRSRSAHRRLLGSGAPAVTWPGSGPAGRLLTGLVQVAFVVAAAGVDSRRPAPPPVPAAGQPGGRCGRGRRRAGGHLVPGRRPASARGNGRCRARLVAGQRGVPRPGPARCRGGGRRGRGSVAEPSLAPDSMDHAGRRGRGPADHRHRLAGRTGTRARRRGDRRRRRAGGLRRARTGGSDPAGSPPHCGPPGCQ